MIIALLLATQAATPPGKDQRTWDNPPTEMVDFLGRRRLCAELGEPENRNAADRAAAARWRCAALPAEERTWRARYADNAQVRAWLDLDPIRFRLNNVEISGYDGPPPARPRRIEQAGVDARTGQPYRLVIETGPDNRRTRITASFANVPMRSFTLDDRQVPFLDLQSLQVMLGTPPVRRPRLALTLRYGEMRGYCTLEERDDRPEIQIVFDGDGVRGYRTDGINCQTGTTDLPDAGYRR
jgi:hypothetical protein